MAVVCRMAIVGGGDNRRAIAASQGRASESDVDDRSLLDLGQPLLHPGFVFLPEQDVADLVPRLDEALAGQGLLGYEVEQVVPDLRPEGSGYLPRLELEDRCLDVGRELTAFQRSQIAAVLSRSVLGVFLGEIGKGL